MGKRKNNRSPRKLSWKHTALLPAAVLIGGSVALSLAFHMRSAKTDSHFRRFAPMIRRTALRHGVDPNLVLAVVKQESNFDPDARGKAGEYGLMQVTRGAATDWERETRRTLRVDSDLFIPELNVEIGTWYLSKALRQFADHPKRDILALSQYNAGRSRALKWAKFDEEKLPADIPISSTRSYILRINEYRAAYQDQDR